MPRRTTIGRRHGATCTSTSGLRSRRCSTIHPDLAEPRSQPLTSLLQGAAQWQATADSRADAVEVQDQHHEALARREERGRVGLQLLRRPGGSHPGLDAHSLLHQERAAHHYVPRRHGRGRRLHRQLPAAAERQAQAPRYRARLRSRDSGEAKDGRSLRRTSFPLPLSLLRYSARPP